MNVKVLNLLAESGLKNDLSFPVWIYKIENIAVKSKRYLKIYYVNRYFNGAEPNQIILKHDDREYTCSRFETVSEYRDVNVFGGLVEIPMEDTGTDVTIVREVLSGDIYYAHGDLYAYDLTEAIPADAAYVTSKLNLKFYPRFSNRLWQCSCGRINNIPDDCCCGKTIKDAKEVLSYNVYDNKLDDYLRMHPVELDISKSFEDNINGYISNVSNYVTLNSKEDVLHLINVSDLQTRYNFLVEKEEERIRAEEERLRLEEEERRKKEEAKLVRQKKMKKASLAALAVVAVVAAGLLFVKFGLPEIRYKNAVSLYEKGQTEEAIKAFEKLDGYKDSIKYIRTIQAESQKNVFEQLGSLKKDDTVALGFYEQDGSIENGAEPISWTVLQAKDDSLVLITKDILDLVPFHDSNSMEELDYKNSTLYSWLNETFYQEVLIGFEEHLLKNEEGTYVTLLSNKEVKTYFDVAKNAKAVFSRYAQSKIESNKGTGSYWLKNTSYENGMYRASIVSEWGDTAKTNLTNNWVGIRPVVIISKKAN